MERVLRMGPTDIWYRYRVYGVSYRSHQRLYCVIEANSKAAQGDRAVPARERAPHPDCKEQSRIGILDTGEKCFQPRSGS